MAATKTAKEFILSLPVTVRLPEKAWDVVEEAFAAGVASQQAIVEELRTALRQRHHELGEKEVEIARLSAVSAAIKEWWPDLEWVHDSGPIGEEWDSEELRKRKALIREIIDLKDA